MEVRTPPGGSGICWNLRGNFRILRALPEALSGESRPRGCGSATAEVRAGAEVRDVVSGAPSASALRRRSPSVRLAARLARDDSSPARWPWPRRAALAAVEAQVWQMERTCGDPARAASVGRPEASERSDGARMPRDACQPLASRDLVRLLGCLLGCASGTQTAVEFGTCSSLVAREYCVNHNLRLPGYKRRLDSANLTMRPALGVLESRHLERHRTPALRLVRDAAGRDERLVT